MDAETLRLVEQQRAFYKQQRDRYRHGTPIYTFNDGRYMAMRDLALELKESDGDGLPETARELPPKTPLQTRFK